MIGYFKATINVIFYPPNTDSSNEQLAAAIRRGLIARNWTQVEVGIDSGSYYWIMQIAGAIENPYNWSRDTIRLLLSDDLNSFGGMSIGGIVIELFPIQQQQQQTPTQTPPIQQHQQPQVVINNNGQQQTGSTPAPLQGDDFLTKIGKTLGLDKTVVGASVGGAFAIGLLLILITRNKS